MVAFYAIILYIKRTGINSPARRQSFWSDELVILLLSLRLALLFLQGDDS
jgi:hypothetical protein